MRVIIESDYQALSQWAANYVASKINAANPTPEKPFVLGCPTGSSPLGMYKALIELSIWTNMYACLKIIQKATIHLCGKTFLTILI